MASSERSSLSNDGEIPRCFYWSTDEVADWVESIGLKQYRVGLEMLVDILPDHKVMGINFLVIQFLCFVT